MKVTIKDVARAAGVSPSTVSRALQNSTRISAEVRARVQQIAQELNFHPNQMARSLVNRENRIIGLVFPDEAGMNLSNPFYPAMMQGLGHVASEHGYQMLLITGGAGVTAAQAAHEAANSGYVSGLVLMAAQTEPPERSDVPVVVIGHPADPGQRFYVDNDNVRAGYEATRFLLDQGHERILLLGYESRFMFTVDRRNGYEQALQEAGIPVRGEWIFSGLPIHCTAESAPLRRLFEQPDRPTAAVCMDDTLAIGLDRLLSSMGLSVPQDVSLIGFNNNELSQYHDPPLTTFDLAPYHLGASAMQLMLDVLSGKAAEAASIDVPFTLIRRQSVAVIGPSIPTTKEN